MGHQKEGGGKGFLGFQEFELEFREGNHGTSRGGGSRKDSRTEGEYSRPQGEETDKGFRIMTLKREKKNRRRSNIRRGQEEGEKGR